MIVGADDLAPAPLPGPGAVRREVRVPAVEGEARRLLEGARCLVATSANLPGGPDPHTIADVPERLRAAAAAVVDVGPLPGTPSTVLDLTGSEPVVVREGAVPAEEALRAVAAVY